jgi:hypothetical protein
MNEPSPYRRDRLLRAPIFSKAHAIRRPRVTRPGLTFAGACQAPGRRGARQPGIRIPGRAPNRFSVCAGPGEPGRGEATAAFTAIGGGTGSTLPRIRAAARPDCRARRMPPERGTGPTAHRLVAALGTIGRARQARFVVVRPSGCRS